jgi:hypothetical protein
MAKALICDRCGKTYHLNAHSPDIGVFKIKPPHLQNEFCDLCEECTEKLREFMNPNTPSNQES